LNVFSQASESKEVSEQELVKEIYHFKSSSLLVTRFICSQSKRRFSLLRELSQAKRHFQAK